MKIHSCSYCDGKGYIGQVPEAIEEFVSMALNCNYEPAIVIQCPVCNGTGIEVEVELEDLARITV